MRLRLKIDIRVKQILGEEHGRVAVTQLTATGQLKANRFWAPHVSLVSNLSFGRAGVQTTQTFFHF